MSIFLCDGARTLVRIERSPMTHRGIHDRGYLPHWDLEDSLQAVTFRLADSLPQTLLQSWKRELRSQLESLDSSRAKAAAKELRQRIAKYEDAGYGCCLLKQYGGIVQEELISGHSTDYRLLEWCVMPNHVHVLLKLTANKPLGSIVQKWKGGTSFKINRLAGRSGALWGPDYFDRYIRDLDHFHDAKAYIRNNPVKAGLCLGPEEWHLSSAALKWSADFSPHPGESSKSPDAD